MNLLRPLRTAVLLGMATVVTIANAEPGPTAGMTQMLSAEVQKQFGTRAQLDAAVEQAYGPALSADKAEVARSYMGFVLQHEALPAYLATMIFPIATGSRFSPADVKTAAMLGILVLQRNGLARLSADKQAAYVTHLVSLLRGIPSADCKALSLGQLDTNASAALERAYEARLEVDKFSAIIALYRHAAEAELMGYPDARTLDEQHARMAKEVHEDALWKLLRTHEFVSGIQLVIEDPHSAPASDVCAFVSALSESVLHMEEPYRTWELTSTMESIRRPAP